jgi:biotin-(acetyl-CoA carboxylase) ligase
MTMPTIGEGALFEQIRGILAEAAPLLAPFIGPIIGGGVGWVAGRRKTDAEVRLTYAGARKAEAEADKAEAETQQIIESILVEKFKEIVDAYEKRCAAMEKKIDAQETEIIALRKALDEKSERIMRYMASQTQTVAFVPEPIGEATPQKDHTSP